MGRVQGRRPRRFGVQSKRSRGMGRVRGRRPRCLVCSRSVAKGWGEFGVADLGFLGVLSPRALLGFGRGQFELCALPRPWFLTTRGAEFCPLSRSLGLE